MDSQIKSLPVADSVVESNLVPSREDLKNLLEHNVVEVDFLKLNGDRRVMTCTMKADLRPSATKADPLSQTAVRETSDAVLSVWDLNAQGWRSFRYERVNGVKVIEQ